MVQYATKSKAQRVPLPESGQTSTAREDWKSQEANTQLKYERSRQKASVATSAASQAQPKTSASRKSRTKSVELPPKPRTPKPPGYSQPIYQINIPEEIKSNPVKVKPRSSAKKAKSQRSRRKNTPLLYGLRLLILGVGIGAIAGTLLSVLDPTSRIALDSSQPATTATKQEQTNVAVQPSALKLGQEILPLKNAVQQLAAKNANLTPGVFFVDLDTGAYLDLNATSTFSAASMIKVPILVAFFQDVDAGKIRLDEKLTLKKELIGGGSGDMQYKPVGTKYTALETATKMIVISDNTATNMLIARLGGIAALNQRFQSWGLTTTEIKNLLPDLPGTNTTTPRDLGQLMAAVNQGDLMSLRSRDRLLDIMRRTKTRTLLPRGLGEGATIAHKTGDIGSMVGDVGLIDMPNGKRYIGVAMVKRPHNDNRAQELIRQISRAAYQEFNKPTVSQIMSTTPFVTTTTAREEGSRGR